MLSRTELIEPLLDIDMNYHRCANNRQTNNARRRLTILLVARFRIIAPILVQKIYGISKAKSLEHLNSLVVAGFLTLVKTVRSPDSRVYVLTFSGAAYAEELMGIHVPFRSQSNPALQFNANSVVHDMILMHCCMLKEKEESFWEGFITEIEFKRIYPANEIRNVDALVKKDGEIIAIEIEGSHKQKRNHETNLIKFCYSLKLGIYQKVFFISPLERVLADTKRFHTELLDELPLRKNPLISIKDASLLKNSLIYRTKFCNKLQNLFYP